MDNEWTKSTVDYIKNNTKLSETQIYKWGYDQKRKRSCKEGIRNSIREAKRRKMSDSEASDYNTMVDLLFPDVEVMTTSSSIRTDRNQKSIDYKYSSTKSITSLTTTDQWDQNKHKYEV